MTRGEEYNDWNEKFSRRNQQQIRWLDDTEERISDLKERRVEIT